MDFIALDLETANSDVSSICSIGLCVFQGGEKVDHWYSLIDPGARFSSMNIGIHGIRPEDVVGAPSLTRVWDTLREMIEGKTVVSHGHFDRTALNRARDNRNLPGLAPHWLDSARVARRAWPDLKQRGGYGLSVVCGHIGHTFDHHHALADAEACGRVLVAAVETTGISVEDWFDRVEKPVHWQARS